ncbi:hypothetical protein P691DRAFT_733432 [Macrolepiota fuliginosa MF-IS2]|uniref:F-box domain-containing protein n=1 Tax=Macrolepiota fuliginosa MF-IS2 TaxID=1400762 RepID=A0A9P6C0A5_9AGAR|nr:hypothetical protein P691DRAFT_733432 [Macrolepiota fuliginosa MF-IS2]
MLLDTPLCAHILTHIPLHRRSDLRALLTTTKAFHAATEPLYYSHLVFTDVRRTRLFINSLNLSTSGPRRAAHVRTFGINLSELRSRAVVHSLEAVNIHVVLRRDFWDAVSAAMQRMVTLETLVLVQMPGVRMDFLDTSNCEFSLRDIKVHWAFDAHVARFLNAQANKGRLRSVQLYNVSVPPAEVEQIVQAQLHLHTIDLLDISFSIAPHVHPGSMPALAYIQILLDTPAPTLPALQNILAHLTAGGTAGLRGLSLHDLPPDVSTPLVQYLAAGFHQTLVHLSHIHLPPPYPPHSPERSTFLASLLHFRRLISIELSLNSWEFTSTATNTTTLGKSTAAAAVAMNQNMGLNLATLNQLGIPSPAAQKALVCEMKTFCPTLRIVVLWLGRIRFRWAFVCDGVPIRCPMGEDGVGAGGVGGEEEGAEGKVGEGGSGSRSSAVVAQQQFGNFGLGGTRGVPSVPPRIENAAVGGEWHYRLETNQWPGYSNLWCTC